VVVARLAFDETVEIVRTVVVGRVETVGVVLVSLIGLLWKERERQWPWHYYLFTIKRKKKRTTTPNQK
jgi:hypothetical protein